MHWNAVEHFRILTVAQWSHISADEVDMEL